MTDAKRSCWIGAAALLTVISMAAPVRAQSATAELRETAHVERQTPAWAMDRVIYEVNVRQYTPEGTFDAFRTHLPRLQEMGVGILWLMPIHPIGEEKRNGTLGSYYAATDYTAVNPEFGTLEDLRELVDEAHARGMFVILDWVANHTAWDHRWTREHPDWFVRGEDGGFKPPIPEWGDVIDLDFDSAAMRDAMIQAMKFWVAEVGVDGYRCDYAQGVPMEFWKRARAELSAIKPVFLLAEAEGPEYFEAFDATYGWGFNTTAMVVSRGEKSAEDLRQWFDADRAAHGPDRPRMWFTTNHDENSWHGTVQERYGDAAEAFAVLSLTLEGIPLIYTGQEVGLDRRLLFFDKDEVDWRPDPIGRIYQRLTRLKRDNPALWHGELGGTQRWLETSQGNVGFGFVRENGEHAVIVIANLSSEPSELGFETVGLEGEYRSAMTGKSIHIDGAYNVNLPAWGWKVLAR
ncbi:MAG: alpha-amylase family glycosyl hydrolase [Planctomycetota bacterium]